MQKFNQILLISMAAVLSAAPAFAQSKCDGKDKGSNCPNPVMKAIDFEEFKERCADPEKFQDVQVAPQNIVVQCAEQRTRWVAGAPGEVPLPGVRHIVTAVTSKKFAVEPSANDVPVEDKPGSCSRFKEIQENFVTELPVTCSDLLNFKGDLTDMCVRILDSKKGGSPKDVTTVETGRKVDNCGDANQGSGKGGKGRF
jgi:hypothetical protein